MEAILIKVVEDTIQITVLVTAMMIFIDVINLRTKGKIGSLLKEKIKIVSI